MGRVIWSSLSEHVQALMQRSKSIRRLHLVIRMSLIVMEGRHRSSRRRDALIRCDTSSAPTIPLVQQDNKNSKGE